MQRDNVLIRRFPMTHVALGVSVVVFSETPNVVVMAPLTLPPVTDDKQALPKTPQALVLIPIPHKKAISVIPMIPPLAMTARQPTAWVLERMEDLSLIKWNAHRASFKANRAVHQASTVGVNTPKHFFASVLLATARELLASVATGLALIF